MRINLDRYHDKSVLLADPDHVGDVDCGEDDLRALRELLYLKVQVEHASDRKTCDAALSDRVCLCKETVNFVFPNTDFIRPNGFGELHSLKDIFLGSVDSHCMIRKRSFPLEKALRDVFYSHVLNLPWNFRLVAEQSLNGRHFVI